VTAALMAGCGYGEPHGKFQRSDADGRHGRDAMTRARALGPERCHFPGSASRCTGCSSTVAMKTTAQCATCLPATSAGNQPWRWMPR